MKKITITLILFIFCQFTFADAENEIKYRQGVMGVVGGHMNSIVAILRGGVHAGDLKMHAQGMANISSIVPTVFPEGSGDGKTEALAVIWEKPDAFKKAMDKYVAAAKGMAKAANSGDMQAVGPAIKELGGSCKGCHDDFREAHD